MAGAEVKPGSQEGGHTIPDPALLESGALQSFNVSPNARHLGFVRAPFSGVLQGFVNNGLRFFQGAPGFVLMDERNLHRLNILRGRGRSFRTPEEGKKGKEGVVFDYRHNVLFGLPHDATWEGVAKAGTKAYAHFVSPSAIIDPDELWEPVREEEMRRPPIEPGDIPAILAKQIVVAGLAKWIALATEPPVDEAQARIASFIPQDKITREKLLKDQLRNVRRAEKMLKNAEKMSSKGSLSDELQSVYDEAYALVHAAEELVGVLYVDDILRISDGIPAENEEKQRKRRADCMKRIILNTPEKLEDFFDISLVFKNPIPANPDDVEAIPSDPSVKVPTTKGLENKTEKDQQDIVLFRDTKGNNPYL